MIGLLKQFFSSTSEKEMSQVEPIKTSSLDAPRYPPTDRGLPLVTVEEVVASQSELINRIQRTAGMIPDEYAKRIQPIIYNFARYVHLLPATNTLNHRGAGGLFRMGLELGLYSLQSANSTSFTCKGSTSAEARVRNHPKWVFATFVAAICSEIYRPISNMVVVDDEGEKWSQLLTPLYDWAISNKKTRYYILWNAQNGDEVGFQQANAAYLLTSIVPQTSLQYLNDGDNDIMLAMTSCVTGGQGNNQITRIVDSVRHKVVQRDIATNSELYGMQIVGAHLEPHLLDAMRRLIKDGTWSVNAKGARVWYSEEGLFVVWQAAAREILKILEKDGRQGIPQDADTLADILIACGAASLTDEGERYWSVQIPVSMQLLLALKIAHPEILLQNSDVAPSEAKLLTSSIVDAPGNTGDRIDTGTGELIAAPNVATSTPPEAAKRESDAADPSAKPADNSALTPPSPTEPKPAQPLDRAQKPQMPKMQAQTLNPGAPKRMGVATIEKTASQPKAAVGIYSPKPAGVIKEKIIPLGSRAEELFGSLKVDVKEYLQAILDDFKNGSSTGPVFCVQQGMAISTDELNSHGQVSFTGLLQALSSKHWLWEDTDNFPNGKKLHDVDHAGEMVKVMIIKADIAREMGFDWKTGVIR